jgi:hypothetical protein
LARIESKPARDFLIATAKTDPDPDLRRVALRVLVGPPGGDHRSVIIRRDGVMIDGNDPDKLRKHLDGLNLPPDETAEPEMLMPPRPGMPDSPDIPDRLGPGPKFGPAIPPFPPLPDGPELKPNVEFIPELQPESSSSWYSSVILEYFG